MRLALQNYIYGCIINAQASPRKSYSKLSLNSNLENHIISFLRSRGNVFTESQIAKGAKLGVVLAFMMGVITLSLPSMIMLKKAIKPKLLGIFIAICTAGIILVGYFFNLIQNYIA